MRLVEFSPLVLTGSEVRVSWRVEPASPIYLRTSFTLDFGDALDPRDLPLKLWWTVVLLIIHCHWNLLRPCRVVLPVTLDAEEIEFWQRMMDQQRVTLEKYRDGTDFERTIEIECAGPVPPEASLELRSDRWATAFSGGKDSLLQAALLCELTERPLLVNACSPMPPLIDNDWPYRDRTMSEIVKRRDVELVIVKSDLRSIWPHYEIPHQLGYRLSMGLIGDTFFVSAVTLAVAASRGIRSFSLATEIENARCDEYHGRTAFYETNITYALPLLLVIDRLVARFGMKYNSLIIPFNHYQVQTLLRKRYADLADLQISCFWMEKPGERSCSRCAKCLRVAMLLMSIGEDPASLDIDLKKMFTAPYNYDPAKMMLGGRTIPYAAAGMDWSTAREFFTKRTMLERLGLIEPRHLRECRKVAREYAVYSRPEVAMTHIEYFRYLPEPLRERIKEISLAYWPDVDRQFYLPDTNTIDSLVDRLTAPFAD